MKNCPKLKKKRKNKCEVSGPADGRGGSLLITADHGNAEQMWNPEADCPHTAHTNYDVPMHLVGDAFQGAALRDGGRLADIAPTVLSMMNLESPEAMLGQSLVE